MPFSDDALGDWRGLHGTHYHLIYALWLIICEHAARVAFYEGNDLRVQPIAPQEQIEPDQQVHPTAILANHDALDIWIQLKATTRPWTASGLCGGNLLANFLVNAITSNRAGRDYVVRLVSQARIESGVVEALLEALDGRGEQADISRISEVIAAVQRRVAAAGHSEPDRAEVVERAREVVGQLHLTTPVYEAAMEAEVERDLTLLYPDVGTVRQIKGTLMAAILKDVAGGPSTARAYGQDWLAQPGVPSLRRRGMLDDDPSGACVEAINDWGVRPRDWDPERAVRRSGLHDVLDRFLAAPEPLLVVTTDAGAGVSWALYDWALRALAGRVRLIVPGADFDATRRLAELVAGRLRRFFDAPWNPDQFLARLRAAAIRAGHGPFVLIVDGIPAPAAGDRARLSRDIARLVDECRSSDIKLVLTCHRHVWEANELGADIPLDALFLPLAPSPPLGLDEAAPRREQGTVERLTSVVLDDLTSDEVTGMLVRNLPADAADAADAALQEPAFRSLRNVSLLARYISLYRDTLERKEQPPVPVVDALLDESVDRLTRAVARGTRLRHDSIKRALTDLVGTMWAARARGLDYNYAIDSLESVVPGQSKEIYDSFVDAGLLTPTGATMLADAAVAERLYARGLLQRYADGADALSELRIDMDGGVTAAILRGADDPIPVAEALLTRDDRWLAAVADGLAHCRSDDRRILALLTVLTRPKPGSGRIVQRAAVRALGTLAARNSRAYRWVEDMYLGEREIDAHRGAQALGAAFDFIPQQVESTMQKRLNQLLSPSGRAASGEREKPFLQALTPLYDVKHRAAARVAARVLAASVPLAGRDEDAQWTLATIRGNVALIGGEDALVEILAELKSPDPVTRMRAAQALRPAAFQRPELVCKGLCDALQVEADPIVIIRLLWTIYRLGVSNPDAVLDALKYSPAVHWDAPSTPSTTALALLTLAVCALERPSRALALLPQRLDALSAEARAVLTEPLTYAWWCCAQGDPSARLHLDTLRHAEITGVPELYRPFALRAAVLAQIGMMRLGDADAGELRDKPMGLGSASFERFTIDTDEYAAHHGTELAAHPQYADLEERLLACADAANRASKIAPFGPLGHALYACEQGCLVLLAAAASHRLDPARLLAALPQEWQGLHVAWRLLDAGCRDPAIIAYARDLCERTACGGTAQASSERRHLLATLARINGESGADVHAFRDALGPLDLVGHGLAYGFAALTDEDAPNVLCALDDNVVNDRDLPLLYLWEGETRSWRSLLIARVYARMFDARPIDVEEAHELVGSVETALHMLPDSPQRRDQETLYRTISDALGGRFPSIAPPLISMASRLGQAHAYAASLLERGHADGGDLLWLGDAALDARGLWETSSFSLKKGSLSWHAGSDRLYYAYPAVRLALVALAQGDSSPDPIARLMMERAQADSVIAEVGWVNHVGVDLTMAPSEIRDAANGAVTRLDEQVVRTPGDERVWSVRGNLLLRLNRLAEAEQSLDRCLSLLSSSYLSPLRREVSADANYDLACAYARTGRYRKCRGALREVALIRPLNRSWMRVDQDLTAVHPFVWFQKICRTGLQRKDGQRVQAHSTTGEVDGLKTAPWFRWHRRVVL